MKNFNKTTPLQSALGARRRWWQLMKSYDTILPSSSALWSVFMPSPFHPTFLIPSAAALKTQPYDLLRWSAAYFRCLSLDVLPPVKPRYEHENVFGCLTKGYLKVLLSQVSWGVMFLVSFLVHHWHHLIVIHVFWYQHVACLRSWPLACLIVLCFTTKSFLLYFEGRKGFLRSSRHSGASLERIMPARGTIHCFH